MKCFQIDLNQLPKILLLGKESLIPPKTHLTRRLDEYVLYCVTGGKLHISVNGKELTLVPGDIYIFEQNDYQAPLASEYCEYYYIHFRSDTITAVDLAEDAYAAFVQNKHENYMRTDAFDGKCYDFLDCLIRQENHISDSGLFKVMRAFQMASREEDGKRMMELFHTHVDNIISIGTSYPKHEVNYEQTIVTPAVTHISEMGMLCENKAYYKEAVETHLECLKRFVGDQPSYFLNQISIRYWDDYWFGKARQHGDTLPHHLSCLTARSYIAYAKLTGNTEYIEYAEECIRNCMCLIGDDGRGSAAHVYPYRTNGQRGDFFDLWSNDQDLVLYDALYLNDVKNVFVV